MRAYLPFKKEINPKRKNQSDHADESKSKICQIDIYFEQLLGLSYKIIYIEAGIHRQRNQNRQKISFLFHSCRIADDERQLNNFHSVSRSQYQRHLLEQ